MIDTAAFQGKKAAYYTLGCKLNFSETSTFAKMLSEMGVVPTLRAKRPIYVSSIHVPSPKLQIINVGRLYIAW